MRQSSVSRVETERRTPVVQDLGFLVQPLAQTPKRGLRGWLGRSVLRIGGWRLCGHTPSPNASFVLIAYPHTSNWDLLWMLGAAYCLGLKVHWMGKKSLFRGVQGWFLRSLGGLAVDRRAPRGMVGQMADLFAEHRIAGTGFVLAVAPEGTRRRVERLKSGFYTIAETAQVPIVLGFLDYGKKCVGISPALMPSGDRDADMQTLQGWTAALTGKFPAAVSPFEF